MENFDVIAYLEDRDIKYTTEGKNTTRGWVNIQCPFPFCDDHSNHCGINLDTKLFSCWKCGEKGSIVKLIHALETCSWAQAHSIVKQFHSYLSPNIIEEDWKPPQQIKIPSGVVKEFSPLHKEYLIQRGFDPDYLIQKYHLLAGGPVGFFKFRIIIPYLLDHEPVTYSGRDITGKAKSKYRHLPNNQAILPAKKTLYNLDTVKDGKCILVEGVTDVWRIGDGCVATSGTQVTSEQILMLSDYGIKKLLIAFDNDAIDEADKLAIKCSAVIPEVKVAELPAGKDPCDLEEKEIKELKNFLA
jgi:hypothetical protein